MAWTSRLSVAGDVMLGVAWGVASVYARNADIQSRAKYNRRDSIIIPNYSLRLHVERERECKQLLGYADTRNVCQIVDSNYDNSMGIKNLVKHWFGKLRSTKVAG